MVLVARPAGPTVVLMLISGTNLALLAVAASYRESEPQGARSAFNWSLVSLSLVASSQLIYIFFGVAWFFGWITFYPGNPVENYSILCGLALCVSGAISGFLGATGLRRFASLLVAAIMGALWLLAAAASVAV